MQQNQKMKALMLQGPMKLSIKQVPVPTPGDGQVLIKVMAAPINPSDIIFIHTGAYDHKQIPSVPGFEGSGVVVANGGGIMGWGLVNKKVAFSPVPSSGSYAQYAIAKSANCLPVDEQMSFEHASMSFVNPLTVIAMLDYANRKKTKTVIMTAAASSLGRMANRLLPQEGVNIINIVRREEQAQILRKQGANFIINSSEADFEQKLKQMATKMNALVCYEAIGGEMTGKVLNCMPKNSIVYIYGALDGANMRDIPIINFIYKNATLAGLFLPTWMEEKGVLKLLPTIIKLRKLLLNQLKSEIAQECSLQQFQGSLKQYLKNMTKGKTILKPHSESKKKEEVVQVKEQKVQQIVQKVE